MGWSFFFFGRRNDFFSSLITRDYFSEKDGNVELSQDGFDNDEEFRPFIYRADVAETNRSQSDETEIGEE